MTRMHWLRLACALAIGMGCSTGEPIAAEDAGDPGQDTGVVVEQDTGAPIDTGPRCPATLAECDGTCVDTRSNPNHCGACGMACTAGQSCMNGTCTAMMRTCPDGQTDCGGTCVNTTSDAMNCGACGSACGAGQMCVGGACMTPAMCPSGQTSCSGACVDTNTDAMNCGRCGGACAAGEACMSGACVAATMCPSGQTACAGVCVNTATDVSNCGACGMACASGENCTGGRCMAGGCAGGQTSCGGVCVDTNTNTMNCGACGRTCGAGQTCAAGMCMGGGMMTCTAPLTSCSGACVDTNTDVANCGRCANACPMGQVCRAGTCAPDMSMCPSGQTSCGGACVDTNTSAMHCGGCGNACPSGQTCQMGACACAMSGQTLCGRSCVNTNTSATNCGACGNACASGESCVMGMCQRTCASGQTACSGACVNTNTDEANCGMCGNACAMGQTCTSGRCGCPSGTSSCTTGMVTACVNLQTDSSNCGRCGTTCMNGQRCVAGACACPSGTTTCSGSCVNIQTDSNNCGRCGTACPSGQSCSAGVCRSASAPANDQRAGAVTISLTSPSQTITANTANARHDTDGSCGCTTGSAQDVFYRFTLTQPEFVYADTFGTTWDTSLFIQDSMGRNVAGAGTGQVACNDDVTSAGFCTLTGNLQSQIAVRLAPGQYFLVVSGCGSGTATVHFQHLPAGNGAAARITPGSTASTQMGTTSGTGTSTAPNCTCSGGPENGYFWVTCPSATAVPFYASTCGGATWDTMLDQRSAARTTSVSVCNDDTGTSLPCGNRSTMTSTIPAGAGLHTLLVDGCTSGAYTVTVSAGTCATGQTRCRACVDTQTDVNNCGGCNRQCAAGQFCRAGACTTPPANDTVTGATVISLTNSSQILSANTTNARHDVNASCGCTNSTTNRDVFYRFTLTAPEVVYADTIGATWDTALAFLTSTGGNISSANITNGATCNDDGGLSGCATGVQSQIFAYLQPGTYVLMVSGCGFGTASVRFQHLPVGNDSPNFLTAGTNRTASGITVGTGRVTGTACPSTSPEDTYVWYTCQNAPAGTFTASTCGRLIIPWDTILAQHSAGRATVRVCNDDGCGTQSSLSTTIPAGPGLHALYIDGYNGANGLYTFQYTRP